MTSFLRSCLLLLCALVFSPIQAASESAHLRAVREMLDATHFELLVREVWNENPTPKIGYRQSMQLMVTRVEKDEILRRFAPIFAAHVDTAQARRIKAAPNSPAAKLLFDKNQPQHKEVGALIYRWADEYHDQLYIDAVNDNLATIERMSALAVSGNDAKPAAVKPTGVGYIDAISAVMLSTGLRATLASAQLNREYAAVDVSNLIRPANLVSPAAIDKGQKALLRAERALGVYAKEIRENLADSSERYKKIDIAGARHNGEKLLESMLAPMPKEYTRLSNFEKSQRALFAIERRFLDLALARQGSLVVQGEQMAFKDQATLDQYTALYKEFVPALEEVRKHLMQPPASR